MKKSLLYIPILLGLLVACGGGNNVSSDSTTSVENSISETVSSNNNGTSELSVEEESLSSDEVSETSEDPVVSEEVSVVSEEDPVVSEENSVFSEEDPVISEENSVVSENTSESYVQLGYVYFNLNDAISWTNVNCYTWDSNGTELSGTWPGSPMEYDTESGYYKFKLGESVSTCNIIFNDGNKQTADLVYESSKPVYQLNSVGSLGGIWTTYGEIVEVASISYYIKGTFNGWGDSNPLTKESADRYSISLNLNVGDEFKFATADWSWEVTNIIGEASSNFDNSGENGNCKCLVAGNYTFVLTISSASASVTQNA